MHNDPLVHCTGRCLCYLHYTLTHIMLLAKETTLATLLRNTMPNSAETWNVTISTYCVWIDIFIDLNNIQD